MWKDSAAVVVLLAAFGCGGQSAAPTPDPPSDLPGPPAAPTAPAPTSTGPAPTAGPVTTMDRLRFAVVGDTRPASPDDVTGYPTPIITAIYADIAKRSPPFVIGTGDYQFSWSRGSGGTASAQFALYMGARAQFKGPFYPVMGNHECTGATASNCGPGQDGTTSTYASFLSTMLAPIGQKEPYYAMQVNATDGSWTAKFVFVAANAWSDAQGTWLEAKLSIPTTYTFVVRHEPARVTEAPGVAPSEAIMAKHPYTIAIVGHSHTFRRESAKEVIVGNGGAPLTGRTNYGYGIFELQKDGQVAVDMVDYQTLVPEPDQHFTVGP